MKLVTYPDHILKKVAKPVTEFGIWDDVIDEMTKIMIEKKGYGLAANQAGLDINLFIMYPYEGMSPRSYFNCEIVETFGEKIKMQEACLSLPNVSHEILRYNQVSIKYQDRNGNFVEQVLPVGITSQCAQHEIQHLKGMLYVDNLDMIKKTRVLKQYSRINFGSSKCT
jgi:peptide deformylase